MTEVRSYLETISIADTVAEKEAVFQANFSAGEAALLKQGRVATMCGNLAIKRAVKMLLYYHPEAPEAGARETLVQRVAQDCAQFDVPLFLEPLSCASDGSQAPLPPEQRREVVIETARRLVPLGVDILKAEFPVDVSVEPNESVWRDACEELTNASSAPWVLLSAGVSYDVFLKQVRVACEAGASGVTAGRAAWSDAVTMDRLVGQTFLQSVGYERMRRLQSLCEALGRPFAAVYDAPEPAYDWYM